MHGTQTPGQEGTLPVEGSIVARRRMGVNNRVDPTLYPGIHPSLALAIHREGPLHPTHAAFIRHQARVPLPHVPGYPF